MNGASCTVFIPSNKSTVPKVKQNIRQCDVLATVNYDILRHDTAFQHALLWVVTATAEQAGRLNLEVADLLFVPVDDAESILLLDFLVRHLYCLPATERHR